MAETEGGASMKALSIKQPWCNAILSGRKTLEVRTWRTDYRGPLLLCASLKPHPHPEQIAPDAETGAYLRSLPLPPYGAAVGVCRLVDCWEMEKQDEAAAMCRFNPEHGRPLYTFVLLDVQRIKPFPVRGALGLFDVDHAIEPYQLFIPVPP